MNDVNQRSRVTTSGTAFGRAASMDWGYVYCLSSYGNGNVHASYGSNVAHYEYGPFGEQTVATGSLSTAFRHRFSTKPLDEETGYYYYGYRSYDPLTGRWMGRDPIGERGGVNLYGMVGNEALTHVDILGREMGTPPPSPGIPPAPAPAGADEIESKGVQANNEEHEIEFTGPGKVTPADERNLEPIDFKSSLKMKKADFQVCCVEKKISNGRNQVNGGNANAGERSSFKAMGCRAKCAAFAADASKMLEAIKNGGGNNFPELKQAVDGLSACDANKSYPYSAQILSIGGFHTTRAISEKCNCEVWADELTITAKGMKK